MGSQVAPGVPGRGPRTAGLLWGRTGHWRVMSREHEQQKSCYKGWSAEAQAGGAPGVTPSDVLCGTQLCAQEPPQ